jgi:hypothetical protein
VKLSRLARTAIAGCAIKRYRSNPLWPIGAGAALGLQRRGPCRFF